MNQLEIIEAFRSGLMWIGLSALAVIAAGGGVAFLRHAVRSAAAWAWRSRTWFEKFAFIGLFTVCILFAGLSSIINMYEVAVANLQDSFGAARVPASVIVHVFGGLSALFIQAIVSQWMDIVSIYI